MADIRSLPNGDFRVTTAGDARVLPGAAQNAVVVAATLRLGQQQLATLRLGQQTQQNLRI